MDANRTYGRTGIKLESSMDELRLDLFCALHDPRMRGTVHRKYMDVQSNEAFSLSTYRTRDKKPRTSHRTTATFSRKLRRMQYT